MNKPTNAVLEAKLDALKELVEAKFKNSEEYHNTTNTHLNKLNGQVAKNTAFRLKGSVYISVFAFIIPFIITLLINVIA